MKNIKKHFGYASRHPIQLRVFIFILVFFIASTSFVIVYASAYHIDYKAKIDSPIVNGILTIIAIVFAFVTFEIREIKLPIAKKFLLHFVMLIFLIYTVISYYGDAMQYGFITNYTMAIATLSFIFSIFYSLLIMILKEYLQRVAL
jgi:phosphatidylglycerophosphate synthase